MPTKCKLRFIALQEVPNFHELIGGGCHGEKLAIATEGNALDPAIYLADPAFLFCFFYVPNPSRTVTARRSEMMTIRTEYDAVDLLRMPTQGILHLPVVS